MRIKEYFASKESAIRNGIRNPGECNVNPDAIPGSNVGWVLYMEDEDLFYGLLDFIPMKAVDRARIKYRDFGEGEREIFGKYIDEWYREGVRGSDNWRAWGWYFAGMAFMFWKDGNWEQAHYELDKMRRELEIPKTMWSEK